MILMKRCPCCQSKIYISFETPCKCIENYKCYYCPNCKLQITKAKAVKKDNPYIAGFLVFLGMIIINLLSNNINKLEIILKLIAYLFLISIIIILLSAIFKRLICIKDNCKEEIIRDNSDLWGSDMPFIKMDSIEKENMHQRINFAVGFTGYGVLVFVVFMVIATVLKYIINLK